MRPLIIVVSILLMSISGFAFAQAPVRPIDVEVTGLDFSYPTPGTIALQAHLRLSNTLTSSATYTSEIVFKLGGNTIAVLPVVFSPGASACSGDPTCSIVCDVQAGAHCYLWQTWTGAACDPSDPGNTCVPIYICACPLIATYDASSSYSGEFTATAVYDPQNQVDEADETNNSKTVALAPVNTEPTTWGRIKALFR